MEIKFTVLGDPQGKDRPRAARRGSAVAIYTPRRTEEYERQIAQEYRAAARKYKFPDNAKLGMALEIYQSIPKHTSQVRRRLMLRGDIRPTKKPDIDNVTKVVMDALNGLAYTDDKFIVSCSAEKFYGEKPRVEVQIFEI